jgi:hypothetical protein
MRGKMQEVKSAFLGLTLPLFYFEKGVLFQIKLFLILKKKYLFKRYNL